MQENNFKTIIGIIRGGEGENFENSITEGRELMVFLNKNFSEKYKVVDVFLDRENIAYINGLPIGLGGVMHQADVVWNTSPAMISKLDDFAIRHISVSPFSNALRNNRSMLEEYMKNVGVKMPRHLVIPAYQIDFDGDINKFAFRKAKEVFEKFGSPWIVHAFGKDANTGIHVAKTFEQLVNAILDIAQSGKSILVEEFISGRVASLHVLPKFRNEDVYIMHNSTLNTLEKEKLENIAKDLYRHIDARHYLKSSFVINKRGVVYLVNIDLKPNLKEYSDLHQSCEVRGLKVSDLVEHMIDQALK